MNRPEIITALCRLMCEVREHLADGGADHAADCFCGESPGPHFRFDAEVLAFVDAAVRESMADPADRPARVRGVLENHDNGYEDLRVTDRLVADVVAALGGSQMRSQGVLSSS